MHLSRMIFAVAIGFSALSFSSSTAQADIRQGVSSSDVALMLGELQQANAELRAQVTGLESQNAMLNGKVETLQFLLTQSREQINDMQVDDAEIDRLIGQLQANLTLQTSKVADLERVVASVTLRLDEMNALETGPAFGVDALGSADRQAEVLVGASEPKSGSDGLAAVGASSAYTPGPEGQSSQPGLLGTLPASALPGEAGPLFAEAKSRLLQFDYAGAELRFRAFLEAFGEDAQAGEAQYWLGEALYQQKAYAESGQAFTRMIRDYPDDPRAPEALVKLARSMRLVGDTQRACSALDVLPQRYPGASGVTRIIAAGEREQSACDS